MTKGFQIEPIGIFKSTSKSAAAEKRLSAPRQSGLARGQAGIIQILPAYRECLKDLEGFDYIWLLFQFHLNRKWKPLVLPPRSKVKRGVFATRSPYRPNPLGLSCLKIKSIDGLKIFVTDTDLVDETPIFDIKPYLAYCDSFPLAKPGWTSDSETEKYQIEIQEKIQKQIQWIEKQTGLQIKDTISNQLEFDPLNSKKKRVKSTENNHFIFSYRTWRIGFSIQNDRVIIEKIYSGYSIKELASSSDPYKDKQIHKDFISLN